MCTVLISHVWILFLLDGLHNDQQNFRGNTQSESEEEEPLTRGDKGAPGLIDSSVSGEENAELVRKWTAVMGPSYEIKVRAFMQDPNVYPSLSLPLSLLPSIPPPLSPSLPPSLPLSCSPFPLPPSLHRLLV